MLFNRIALPSTVWLYLHIQYKSMYVTNTCKSGDFIVFRAWLTKNGSFWPAISLRCNSWGVQCKNKTILNMIWLIQRFRGRWGSKCWMKWWSKSCMVQRFKSTTRNRENKNSGYRTIQYDFVITTSERFFAACCQNVQQKFLKKCKR